MIVSTLRRGALAVFGGTAGAAIAAALDARYALGDGGKVAFGDLFSSSLGLVTPLCLVVSAAVGVGLVALDPEKAWSPADVARALRDGRETEGGARRAASLALALVASFVLAVTLAHLARGMLAAPESPRVVGATMASSALLVGLVLALGVARATGPLASALARTEPLIAPGVALVLVLGLGAFGIASGTPGGEGSILGILGVLKRQELDLRAPGLLSVVALCAALGSALPRRVFAPLAFAVALAPLVLTVRAAGALDASPTLTSAVERDAPLGKIALRALRKATDRDHDGFSRTFGGGDCNDRDARIYPTAIDEPGNGIDEDCSGSDAPVPKAAPVATAPAATRAADERRVPKDLNVLFVTIDTLRADLGYAGNPRPVSPSLDALAARAVVFENGYSLASYTGKSVGPLLSGKYPSETHRGWSHFNTFPKDDTMVAERLSAAGVKTLSVQAHWYFERFSGLGRGFDALDMTAFPGAGAQQDNDTSSTSEKLTDAAIKRLSDPAITGGRFFAWVHYLDPHADYLRHPDTPDFGRDMRGQYDHEVAFTDRHIGRLLAFVAEQPWGKNTAIVVTSDHGEAFGEHKLIRHGFEVWEELVRVPLIVYVPGVAPHRIKARRSAIDLVPTILELTGVEPKLGATPSDFLSGVSLVPDLYLAPDKEPEVRDIFVDMPAGPNNDERRAYYVGDKKLYVSSGYSFQLFDLAKDPGEKEDLASSDKEALADMKAKYDAFRAKLREVRVKPIPK